MTADRSLSDSFIWSVAIVLSLSAHFIIFWQRQTHLAAPSTVIQETITHVRFSTLAPPPVKVSEPEVTPPKPEPVVIPEPVKKTEVKPKPVPKPKPKPIPKPKPKKAKKPVKKTKPVPKKEPVKQKQAPVAQSVKTDKVKKVSPIVAQADTRLIEQTRMTYHALLMRHIEVHKNYPRVARKRKIQGDILVTFTLLADGQIKNLNIIGKKSILKKATSQAIEYALPMPKPPKTLSLPMEIKFTMNYHLR